MTDNAVIHAVVVAIHASAALLSLTLGGAQLGRRRYGDRMHRRSGRVWVAAMYLTVVSSFLIQDLRPGQLTLFHALSVFTFGTLTTGFLAAVSGNIPLHRRMMTGSWFGVVGAFLGAVAVPSRTIPQLALHQPWLLAAWVAAVAAATYVLVSGRVPGRPAARQAVQRRQVAAR
jgi:uncharacterized membrane protein